MVKQLKAQGKLCFHILNFILALLDMSLVLVFMVSEILMKFFVFKMARKWRMAIEPVIWHLFRDSVLGSSSIVF